MFSLGQDLETYAKPKQGRNQPGDGCDEHAGDMLAGIRVEGLRGADFYLTVSSASFAPWA
jgi:hypothetical protein